MSQAVMAGAVSVRATDAVPVACEPTNKRCQGRVRREESKRIQRRHYSMHIVGIISSSRPSSEDEEENALRREVAFWRR